MSFKDDYREYNKDIKLDKEFLDKLADDINKERRSKISIRRSRMITATCSACACILVVCGIALSTLNFNGIEIIAEGEHASQLTEDTSVGSFGAELWYSEDMSDEEIVSLLASRLADTKDIEKVYCSVDSYFDDDELLSDDEIKELSDKLASAEVSGQSIESNDEKRYMLVFGNGDIVKIRESSSLILIEDTGCCYKIK